MKKKCSSLLNTFLLLTMSWCLTGWLLADYWLTNARLMPDYCLTTAWLLPGYCLTTVWLLPDYCLTITWILFSTYLGEYLVCSAAAPWICPWCCWRWCTRSELPVVWSIHNSGLVQKRWLAFTKKSDCHIQAHNILASVRYLLCQNSPFL